MNFTWYLASLKENLSIFVKTLKVGHEPKCCLINTKSSLHHVYTIEDQYIANAESGEILSRRIVSLCLLSSFPPTLYVSNRGTRILLCCKVYAPIELNWTGVFPSPHSSRSQSEVVRQLVFFLRIEDVSPFIQMHSLALRADSGVSGNIPWGDAGGGVIYHTPGFLNQMRMMAKRNVFHSFLVFFSLLGCQKLRLTV